MKIDITVLGEKYTFKYEPIIGSMNCKIRQMCTNKIIPCTISNDYEKIILSEHIELNGYKDNTSKVIKELKIPKNLKEDIEIYSKVKI